ncbi:PET117 [Brettanomyces bruxellensis]|uniref:DEBR0S4_03906g1_1 n=1 Tax=Dekkera bruxellensis TaxID=5007 RepID=A0A7D9H3M7_DEKBR|nr:PET117 [Brettanomyces bruxellensis]
MSTASKITLAASICLCTATCIGVYWLTESERDALKWGPIKDQARLNKRNMSKKQLANRDDFEAQKKLKEKLLAEQEVTGKIVTADDGDSSSK